MLSSNFVGVSAVIFLLSILAYVIMSDERWIVTAAFGFAMMVPFSTMFAPTKYKYSLLIYTGIMLILGLVAIFEAFATGRLLNQYTTIFFFAFIGFQFVANYLLIREDNR